jgi:inner membrane protein
VDSITQAALGAAVGEALLGKRLGNRALAWGAVFGTLPDLDALVAPFLDTAANLWWHRGPSHSLLVMLAGSWFLGRWLAKLWKREKISRPRAIAFVLLAWSTHVLIDCFNVYGTAVLWPFTPTRISFNQLFVVDPLYTLPLLVTLGWLAFLRKKKQLPKRRRLCAWGLGLSTAYALLALAIKSLASAGFAADLDRRGVTYERRMEAPTAFNIVLWRAVVDRGDELWVGYRTIFEFPDTPVRWTVYPRGGEAMAAVAGTREAAAIDRFSHGWWIARSHRKGVWLADLRFGEMREWGRKREMVDCRPAFAWSLDTTAQGDRLAQIQPDARNAAETLRRLGLRVVGKRDAWEANPRLAGITGSFPEPLQVVE